MVKKNVFVFPCGSEVALEVYRSLKNSAHFNLIGGNSVDDHGRFVYENYLGDIPFITEPGFIDAIKQIVFDKKLDFIYPTMDSVITCLKENEQYIGCSVISSPLETTQICLSKEKTYSVLKDEVKVPKEYTTDERITYPIFGKPKIGYGARGAQKIDCAEQMRQYIAENPDALLLEYLPGEEYTVDCFTDRFRNLLFCGARTRNRIRDGISVNTTPAADNEEFMEIVNKINERIVFRGAWFVQLKRNACGELVLMEVASRLGGSSELFRARGINFAQLSLFDAMGCDVSIIDNRFDVELDRALDCCFKISIDYNEVFLDYDDTVMLGDQYNTEAIRFIYQCKNQHKKVTLLSSHVGDLEGCLEKHKISSLFDRVIHISKKDNKADYIDNKEAIFIDDSFSERKKVFEKAGISVFSLDMLDQL